MLKHTKWVYLALSVLSMGGAVLSYDPNVYDMVYVNKYKCVNVTNKETYIGLYRLNTDTLLHLTSVSKDSFENIKIGNHTKFPSTNLDCVFMIVLNILFLLISTYFWIPTTEVELEKKESL